MRVRPVTEKSASRWLLILQLERDPEAWEEVVIVEPGDAGDVRASEREHDQAAGVRNRCLPVLDVGRECRLGVGARGQETCQSLAAVRQRLVAIR